MKLMIMTQIIQLSYAQMMSVVKKAQERIAKIDRGAVQTIPGDITLAQIRQLSKK